MEPVTHALTSLALARAAQGRLPRYGTTMILVSGVAADFDYASYLGGAGAFLRLHRALLHSLLGSAVLICAIATVFCYFDRKRPSKSSLGPLRFLPAVAVCSIGVAWHLVLDCASGESVQLLWPFKVDSLAWNLTTQLDPWMLVLLVAGLLLPNLFHLVSEEIGERKKGPRGRRGALVTLFLLVAYLGARGILHSRAEGLLLSREYHGRAPFFAGAFPSSASVFEWRGVVVTDNTIEEVEVSLAPGAEFNPDRSLTHFKPEESPTLDAGEVTPIAKTYLAYARFPLASVIRIEDGYRFELHDLQFSSSDTSPGNIFVRVDFDSALQIRISGFHFASSPNQ